MKRILAFALGSVILFSSCKKSGVSLPSVDVHGSMDMSLNNKNYHFKFATIGKDPNSGFTALSANDGASSGIIFIFNGTSGTYNFGEGNSGNLVTIVATNIDNASYVSTYEDCTTQENKNATGTLSISSWADVKQNIKGSFNGNLALVNGSCASSTVPFTGTFTAYRLE